MNFKQFAKFVESVEKPVVLLEGSRNVLEKDAAHLTELAAKLSRRFPQALFRSGGASGSDDLFALGVFRVDKKQLQLVLPDSKKTRQIGIDAVLFDDLPESELEEIFNLTVKATPVYKSLVDLHRSKIKGQAHYKTRYLLRDTLKVCGSKSLRASPANIGCFYVNSDKPTRGGTGHTIRVCELLNVPAIEQVDWLNWL